MPVFPSQPDRMIREGGKDEPLHYSRRGFFSNPTKNKLFSFREALKISTPHSEKTKKLKV
jgi:hypothetical protein